MAPSFGVGPGGGPSHKKAPFLCEGPPPGPLRRRVPPITVGPHPGSQYLAPALALGSPVLAPQGHPTSGYLVKSPLTISFATVRVRSCELRRYNHLNQNSAVKRARTRVVLGWVTSWEVLSSVGSESVPGVIISP